MWSAKLLMCLPTACKKVPGFESRTRNLWGGGGGTLSSAVAMRIKEGPIQ
jgi:hypothetical protein